jgi:RNA polymerase sigma-70 factor (ECF subfamily)
MMQFDDSSFDNEELYDAMHQAIRALPEKCRDIFLLSRFEGLSHHEIATRLGISTSTVNNQISLAMKKLKERLRP